MRTGNFNIHFGFVRFEVDGLFDADVRVAFSLVFFDFFSTFLCFGLVFLADVFLFEAFFIACIRIACLCLIKLNNFVWQLRKWSMAIWAKQRKFTLDS